MSGSHGYVQLPPDGTGKQVPQAVMLEFNYNNGTIDLEKGQVVTFEGVANFSCTIIELDGTTSSGEMHVRVEEPVPNTMPTISVGTNIQVNAVTHAQVAAVTDPYYFQQNQIVGHEMTHIADVTKFHEQVMTFRDGAPQFDAFGKLQVSQQHRLAQYVHSYDELPNVFTTEITGGASLTYDNNTRGVTLSCGTASGDKIVRTSNEYHHYQPGISQLLEFTAALGDSGKENVTRRMGYYDDSNGIFIEMVGTTFNFGIRSKSTGSVVNTVVPQSEWNGDRLDGTGSDFNPTGYAVDPTKDNIYWIDLQWLGAGTVRFGIIIEGLRVTCHEIHNANSQTHSYMSTGSLPFRYEQENTGIAASTSEMKVFCATIKTEGEYVPEKVAATHQNSVSTTAVTDVCLLGIRAAQTFKTFDNRVSIYPREFCIHNPAAEPVVITLALGATITGGAWVAKGGESAAELNTTATGVSGGNEGLSFIVAGGATKHIEFDTLGDDRVGIRRNADITTGLEVAIKSRLLFAGTGGVVYIAFNWDEVRD